MVKRFVKSPFGQFILGWALALVVAVIMLSVRWNGRGRAEINASLRDQDGVILVFWHERILAMPWLWPRRYRMNALQSPHPDGRLMARVVNHLGVNTIWGSSNRQALSGFRSLKRTLDQGKVVAITPDGPRGPARQSANGPVALANLTQKPILPVAWSVDRYWRAPGWDGMIIPKPFSRGVFLCGNLIDLPKADTKDDLRRHRMALQSAMNDITDRADASFGTSLQKLGNNDRHPASQ